MTQTSKRNEDSSKAFEAKFFNWFDKSNREDGLSMYVTIHNFHIRALNTKDRERDEAVAEAFKAGQKSLLKNLRRLTPRDYGKRCSYIIVDEMGEFDWAKIEELTTPPKQTQHDDTK